MNKKTKLIKKKHKRSIKSLKKSTLRLFGKRVRCFDTYNEQIPLVQFRGMALNANDIFLTVDTYRVWNKFIFDGIKGLSSPEQLTVRMKELLCNAYPRFASMTEKEVF